MVWILFFIAVGFALWYRKLYQEAERSAHYWMTNTEEWKEKFHEVVREVTNKK